jgi:ketosteroid isomerase-like protein
MSENVALVGHSYDALARGDIDGFFAVLDPQIEWVHPPQLPYGGTHTGLQGMLEVLSLWREAYEEMQVLPREFLDAGDAIVVIGRYRLRPQGHEDLETWFVHVFDLTDGKITRFRDYSDKGVRLATILGAIPIA